MLINYMIFFFKKVLSNPCYSDLVHAEALLLSCLRRLKIKACSSMEQKCLLCAQY